jgi:aspartyl-tRNA(Asn)/glutamyl-tRNA(Gln) amidotransferase subunit A
VIAADHAPKPLHARPLWSLSAVELARAFQAKELSPVTVLEAILDRANRINPAINAIVTWDRESARAASRSEERWCSGEPRGLLDGVPLTIKDNIPVKGLRTTWGSRVFADYVATDDELVVARLRAQGAVIVGKTNCPEFTLQGYTDNALFGPTRNPWDLRLTPGGSSGGAVAALASGLCPLAIGTDGGGSIRRPAAHTGLVGFKPTAGRIARACGLPVILYDFEVVGPIARTTEDVALLFVATAGPDPRDRASLAFRPPHELEDPNLTPQRILYVPRFGDAPVDSEIAASVAEAASSLERLGHVVEEGEAPFDLSSIDRVWSVVAPAGLVWLLRDHPEARDKIGSALGQVLQHGITLTAAAYVDALDRVTQLRALFVNFFQRFDAILTPTTAALAWPAQATHPDSIAGRSVGPRGHAVFTAFANVAGLPGISIPCRPSKSGLPIGFQLVGPFGGDERLLGLALQFERAHPWVGRWPDLE